MGRERVIPSRSPLGGGERWTTQRRENHWYGASTDYAVKRLGKGEGGTCLVVGSPLFEAVELAENGWEVTYLDVRVPPHPRKFMNFVLSDASSMPFKEEFFDSVSSSCVLAHVGLGRYGDPLVEDGDEKALSEICRVMKKGSKAAITFGPVFEAESMCRVGTDHRIYTIKEAKRMLETVGLVLKDLSVWTTDGQRWLEPEESPGKGTGPLHLDYLSVFVSKC